MTTVYQKLGVTPALKALAGDSVGTSANWIESTSTSLHATWEAAHGAASVLSVPTWDAWKAKYQEPVNIGGAGAGFSDQQKFELGQAVTSGAILVNDHIDETPYNISLNVPIVPGTATGTATPNPA